MKKISTLFKKDQTNLGRVIDEVAEENRWVTKGDAIATHKRDGTSSAIFSGKLYKRYDARLKRRRITNPIIGQTVIKLSGKPFKNRSKKNTIEQINVTNTNNPSATSNDAVLLSCGSIVSLSQLSLENDFIKEYKKSIPVDAIPCQDADLFTGHHPHWIACDRNQSSDKYHYEAFDTLLHKLDGTYELCGPKVQGNPENFDAHVLIKHGSEKLYPDSIEFDYIKEYLETNDIEGIVFHDLTSSRMCKIRKNDFGFTRNSK